MKDNSIVILFRMMKWVIKTVLIIFGILPSSGCGAGYREKNGKVTFNGEEITDKNFIVLNKAFAKDSTTVYYKERAFEYADAASFEALDEHYAKDKDKAYYCDEYREGQNYYLTKKQTIVTIRNAITNSFVSIQDNYAKDNKRAYYKGIGFEVKDAVSLAVIEGDFLKDKYLLYFEQKPVKNADANSFRLLNNAYARDTSHVFYYGYHNDLLNGIHEIDCQVNSFTVLEYPYSKDNESVFYVYTKIAGSDAASFSVVGNGFSKDKDHVYFESKILKAANAASFMTIAPGELQDDHNYAKDKDHVFYKSKMFEVDNVANFKLLGLGYTTDGKYIYFNTARVKNADVASFKIYDHGYGDADAEDANSKYLEGQKVKG